MSCYTSDKLFKLWANFLYNNAIMTATRNQAQHITLCYSASIHAMQVYWQSGKMETGHWGQSVNMSTRWDDGTVTLMTSTSTSDALHHSTLSRLASSADVAHRGKAALQADWRSSDCILANTCIELATSRPQCSSYENAYPHRRRLDFLGARPGTHLLWLDLHHIS